MLFADFSSDLLAYAAFVLLMLLALSAVLYAFGCGKPKPLHVCYHFPDELAISVGLTVFEGDSDEIRLVPTLGRVTEQSGALASVPQRILKSPPRGVSLMGFKLSATQQVPLSVKPVDKKGNPATLDGPGEWFVDNTDMVTIDSVSADGLSCMLKAVGPLGSGTITFKGDGKAGPEVFDIVGTFDYEIGAGDAVTVKIEAGTPVEQPE